MHLAFHADQILSMPFLVQNNANEIIAQMQGDKIKSGSNSVCNVHFVYLVTVLESGAIASTTKPTD